MGTIWLPCAFTQASANWAVVRPATGLAPESVKVPQIFRQIVSVKTRHVSPHIALTKHCIDLNRSCQKTTTQGAKCNHRHIQCLAGFNERNFGVAVQREYSDCTAATGYSLCALESVFAETSDSPTPPILPSSTNLPSSPTLSSTGTPGSSRCR